MAKKLYKAKIGTKHIMVDLEHLPYGEYNEKTPLVITEKVLLEKALQYTNLANVHFSAGIEMQNTVLPTEDVNETLIIKPVEITVEEYLENPFARRNMSLDFDAYDYHVQSEKTEPVKEQKPAVVKPVKKEKKKKTVAEPVVENEKPVVAKTETKEPVAEKPVVHKAPIESVIALVESVAKSKTVVEQKNKKTAVSPMSESVKPIAQNPSRYVTQSNDYMNLNEIYMVCKNNPLIQSFGLSEDALTDMIRKLMKDFNRQIMLSRQTNSPISCIESAKVPEILKKIQSVLSKRTKPKETESQKPVPQTRKQLESVRNFSAMPIKIKKYIPQRLWKDICKACGKHDSIKKLVINNIYAINTDLNETRASAHVNFIVPETLERKASPYIKRENDLCIVQSISNTLNKDNKRIIWTYVPNARVFVCTGVFTEHTKAKTGNNYAKVRDFASFGKDATGQPIDLSTIIDNPNYIDVDDLWAKFNQPQTAQIKTEKPVETRSGNHPVKPAVKPAEVKTPIGANVENVKSPASIDIEDVKDPTNTEIEQAKSGLTKEEGTEPEKPVIIPDKPVANLSDVIVAQKQVEAVIKLINATVNDNIQSITTEANTQKQIEEIDLIRAALVKKQALQNALSEMSGLDTLLAQIKTIKQR